MAGASPALDSARALTLASGDTKVLLSVMAPPRAVMPACASIRPAVSAACPPSASATTWATVSAPPVARSSTPRPMSDSRALSSHSVPTRSAASASPAAIAKVISA